MAARPRTRQRQPKALSHRRRATVPAPLPSGCSAPVSGDSGLAGCLLGLPCRLPPSRAAWPPCPGGFCATVAAWRCLDCRPVQASIPLHHSRSPSRALCVHAAAAARRRRPWASLRGSMACPATEVSCSPSWALMAQLCHFFFVFFLACTSLCFIELSDGIDRTQESVLQFFTDTDIYTLVYTFSV